MPAQKLNPKVDAYIEKARPFAQPILAHLRKAIHAGCPQVDETIKWSRPFFEYRSVILCNISGFKEHCSLGFWGLEIGAILRKAGVVRDGAMGSLALIESGRERSPIAARPRVVKPAKPALKTPPDLKRALAKNKKASAAFAAFGPSCRREYIEWIVDAKRLETREQRIATAVTWTAEGKQRNWKYQK
jgi:uncharacterized protein YdeI (YjbR/CyaY-like superfamily)